MGFCGFLHTRHLQKIHLNKLIAIPIKELHKPYNFPIFASKEELARMPPTYIVEAACDLVVNEVA
jgi:hypothetical protein